MRDALVEPPDTVRDPLEIIDEGALDAVLQQVADSLSGRTRGLAGMQLGLSPTAKG